MNDLKFTTAGDYMSDSKNTVWLVPIEPIDQRYTKQWYNNIPSLIKNFTDMEVVTIDGVLNNTGTTPGAFLDFGKTNKYKASQVQTISQLFTGDKTKAGPAGQVQPGDHFVITDAWNFGITAIKYMSELLDIPVTIHGIWHAGHYDPTDILGMKMSANWAENLERSLYYCCDYNYFATDFHKNMFLNNLNIPVEHHYKAIRSGQPHNHIVNHFQNLVHVEKTDTIVWPHRYNPDKQPEIIEDIKRELAGKIDVVITQQENLSKTEYYDLLNKSKMVFSCSLHENLGISQMEGVLAGCIPLMPNRASYVEMYDYEFLYPSGWTHDFSAYKDAKTHLIDLILDKFSKYNTDNMNQLLDQQKTNLMEKYLTADVMFSNIK